MEFTAAEKQLIDFHDFIIRDDRVFCGPYVLFRTAKMYRIVHVNGSSKVYKSLGKACNFLRSERLKNLASWLAAYPFTPPYRPYRKN